MSAPQPFSAIVLAGRRRTAKNKLAERAGVSHKCLVPIAGRPLIEHVVDALTRLPNVAVVRVSVERAAEREVMAALAKFAERGVPIECVASGATIAANVLDAVDGLAPPYLVTTADNVLLTPESCRATLTALREADAVTTLARKQAVLAVHPQAQRNFYRFRDGSFSNCNVYGLAGPRALRAVEVFRQDGQFAKHRDRLVAAFGAVNVALFALRLLSVRGAMRRVSKRLGLTLRALITPDGSQAIDVDNARTHTIAEMELLARAGDRSAAGVPRETVLADW